MDITGIPPHWLASSRISRAIDEARLKVGRVALLDRLVKAMEFEAITAAMAGAAETLLGGIDPELVPRIWSCDWCRGEAHDHYVALIIEGVRVADWPNHPYQPLAKVI
jgi:hypothetical protein